MNQNFKGIFVFMNGIGGLSGIAEGSQFMHDYFALRGYQLVVLHAKPGGSIVECAAQLRNEVDRLDVKGKFHLGGHSMGCLAARLALQDPMFALQVLSTSLISGPHRGAPLADWLEKHRDESKPLNEWGRACHDLTSASMAEFNLHTPDVSSIPYFSLPFKNDGLVSVESATWGKQIMVGNGAHLLQVNPFIGNLKWLWTFGRILDNLDSEFHN